MNNLTVSSEDLPKEWAIIGGRGLSAKILNREMPPDADPLGPEARFIIAGGPVAGTLAPSCGRISVGGKSPLTFGIKEANVGGPFAQKLDKLGYRALVAEGTPKDGSKYILVVTQNGTTFEPVGSVKAKKNYDFAIELQKKYGDKIAVAITGIVGERGSTGATVSFTDKDGHCSRHAARGGLGAVMAAKGLKAIVLDDSGTPAMVDMADREAFSNTMKEWASMLKDDPSLKGMSAFGTPSAVVPLRGFGSMPSKNYSSEPTPGFENLGGEAIKNKCKERGGKMDGCMPGCLVRCSIIYNDADGNHLTSGLEYETLGLMGTNLGIADTDAVARFDRICDDLGIDTIELGSAMGVAASAGKMKMGDIASAMALLDEVEKGTDFGKTLANGVVATAKALGITRIPAFRGQAIPAHDPRVSKGTGVSYMSSPMGADHTAGLSYNKPTSPEGKVEDSRNMQIGSAALDTLGYCILAAPGNRARLMEFLRDLINARYGTEFSVDDLNKAGVETIKDELKFNKGTEFYTAHEHYPEFIMSEPSAPTGSKFDVNMGEIAAIWEKIEDK